MEFFSLLVESERLDQLSASYLVSTGAHSLWVRRSRREAYSLSPSSAEFKIQSSYTSTSHTPLWHGAYVSKGTLWPFLFSCVLGLAIHG